MDQVTIRWDVSEVTSYLHTFDVEDLNLTADQVAEVADAARRGEVPGVLVDRISGAELDLGAYEEPTQ